ncbi:TetR family transcriptional regulator [Sinorhizobium fredii]|uniref:TetR family transcriptional regulator n=1 Tax=Rhizobium fredii TaxID=380 RepID=UPI00351765C7
MRPVDRKCLIGPSILLTLIRTLPEAPAGWYPQTALFFVDTSPGRARATSVAQAYLATGMLELREKASVSGGAVAHHFPAKRELGLAVIRDRVAETVQRTWSEPLRA